MNPNKDKQTNKTKENEVQSREQETLDIENHKYFIAAQLLFHIQETI